MAICDDSLSAFRREVAEAFEAGMPQFPHYTLHGREHLDELDRLALLIGNAILLPPERLQLLRLALIMHDYSMVNVVDPDRENELRRQLSPGLSFADLVRKTHQDEIEQKFSEASRANSLARQFGPQNVLDAVKIAKHHRFHPLRGAPEELQELCALARIIDELDIGPNRAPLTVYEARRSRMEPLAKFHWLKHICTRAISDYGTFQIEQRRNLRILCVQVRVEATESSQTLLQEAVTDKIRECLEDQGANEILAQYGAKFALSGSEQSEPNPFLPDCVKEDLEELVQSRTLGKGSAATMAAPSAPVASGESDPSREVEPTDEARAHASTSEFRLHAIPPEKLDEFLCTSGRLTVIGNTYVDSGEEHVSGVKEAPNRIYVGPADCGKTRAAAEWIRRLVGHQAAQWLVLRTDMGIVPDRADLIVLDTSLYEGKVFLPQKAVLFLDDLPLSLPRPGSHYTETDAVRQLFDWFRQHPNFREKRVVGTIRNEDVQKPPDWPSQLPSLGLELELVRLRPLDDKGFRKLWQCMQAGAVSRSRTGGLQSFHIEIPEGFIKKVASQRADPEAVATFVQQKALKSENALKPKDAEGFFPSAVQTWLRETWPAILEAYGAGARVFFTLARFLEAGLRVSGGFRTVLFPHWSFHAAFGQELLSDCGDPSIDYLASIVRLVNDGHAVGERNEWIRPKYDFLLQADSLPGVTLKLPDLEWLANRADRLDARLRQSLASHISASELRIEGMTSSDPDWCVGWGEGIRILADAEKDGDRKLSLREEALFAYQAALDAKPVTAQGSKSLAMGLLLLALNESDTTKKRDQLCRALEASRRSTRSDPTDAQAWNNLGGILGLLADGETSRDESIHLRRQEVQAYRNATKHDPAFASLWCNLGIRLRQLADEESEPDKIRQLQREEIQAYFRALQADPLLGQAWYFAASRLGRLADEESEPGQKRRLRQGEVKAYRNATGVNPTHANSWFGLGSSLGLLSDEEPEPGKKRELRLEGIQAYRKATECHTSFAEAWSNLGALMAQMADEELDPVRKRKLRQNQILAYHRATESNPTFAEFWLGLAIGLVQAANEEANPGEKRKLRKKAIQAYRRATEADPSLAKAWSNLGSQLLQQADEEPRSDPRTKLRREARKALQTATRADPSYAPAWHNQGFMLAHLAQEESDPSRRCELLQQAIQAYRKATKVDPSFASAWNNLGVSLGLMSDEEPSPSKKKKLRHEEIQAYRRATRCDPTRADAWSSLGFRLWDKAEEEPESAKKKKLYQEAVQAYRCAAEADQTDATALLVLGTRLRQFADRELEPAQKHKLRQEELQVYRRAIKIDPSNTKAWNNLGVSFGQQADEEAEPSRKSKLRQEEIQAYRRAIKADPAHARAWNNLGMRLMQQAENEIDPEKRRKYYQEAVQACRHAAQADPSLTVVWCGLSAALFKAAAETGEKELINEAREASKKAASLGASRYQLAWALAFGGQIDEALLELEGCLDRGEIKASDVKNDPDWKDFTEDSRFKELLSRYE